MGTDLRRDVASLLHERHLCRALDGPEGVYEGSEGARHGARLQQGTDVSLVEPRVGGLGAVVPKQRPWKTDNESASLNSSLDSLIPFTVKANVCVCVCTTAHIYILEF